MDPAAEDPILSVIVCHHRGDLWRGCFATIAKSVGMPFELIVVSSDPPASWAGEWFTVLCEQGGPAHKRNVGARSARGQYLVFLDDDTEVSPYTLYEFKHGLETLPNAGMVFARIFNGERRHELDDCGSWLTWTGFLYARAGDNPSIDSAAVITPTRCLASKSAGCAIRREVFYDAGGFDASYFILGEETDLAWRVWLRGHEVWYWPRATLWHWFNTGAKPVQDYYTLHRIHYLGCRNYLSLLFTSLGTLRLVAILPLHMAIWMGAILGFALRGQWGRGWHILRGLGAFWLHLPWAKRRTVQSTRVRTDRALWPHIAYTPHWTYYPRRMKRYIWNMLHG